MDKNQKDHTIEIILVIFAIIVPPITIFLNDRGYFPDTLSFVLVMTSLAILFIVVVMIFVCCLLAPIDMCKDKIAKSKTKKEKIIGHSLLIGYILLAILILSFGVVYLL
ncbi:MAG: hypothetical protein OXU73_00890 [Candidatus Campbellbacteria bacterium]|nr:hypothetical protein [Candidatus Campbellbacteria bacterium]